MIEPGAWVIYDGQPMVVKHVIRDNNGGIKLLDVAETLEGTARTRITGERLANFLAALDPPDTVKRRCVTCFDELVLWNEGNCSGCTLGSNWRPKTEPPAKAPCVTKKDVLDKAIAAVADRGLNYGKPEENFDRIARLWNSHLVNRGVLEADILADPAGKNGLTADDVAIMMSLMKIARLENSPDHLDSWVDLAGYAACGGELTKAR